jgi:hypothetical protein
MMEWADDGKIVEIVWIQGKIVWDAAVRENTALPVCVCVCVQVFVCVDPTGWTDLVVTARNGARKGSLPVW